MDSGNLNNVNISGADLDAFMSALDECKGNVYLVTDEGDKLNLKSQFCRMIGILHIVEGGRFSGGKLECENVEDANKLFKFNLFGKTK